MRRLFMVLALLLGVGTPAAAEIPNIMVLDAQAAAKAGDYGTALDLYTRAIDSGELNQTMLIAALNGRGLVYYRLRQFPQAIDDYTRALSLNPDNPTTLRNRCFAFIELREWGYALDDCRASAALIPDDPQGADTLGYLYLRQGKYVDAISYFNGALAVDPNYGPAYMHRGMAWYALGDRMQGRADLLRAQELMPGNKEVEGQLRKYGLIP
ncbi:MAG TPA: tetratricopeptide repeat protein [Kiloniellales bacterium]|nr:tetratricopeptide repeat protein [Kiloniellales bacterium]